MFGYRRNELVDLLTMHADALNAGQDQTESLALLYGDEVAPLLQLARAVKQVLVPVSPPAGFTTQLHHDLMQYDRNVTIVATHPNQRGWWVGAATVGSLLSLAILLLVRRHRGGPLPELLEVPGG